MIISVPLMAAQTEPLPDIAAPGYHPGLFGQKTSMQTPIPPVVNTFEGSVDEFSYIPPSVSYSYFPGDIEKGDKPSIVGYISGTLLNPEINISGRIDSTDSFHMLDTISPDERGIFIWLVPDWASDFTEFFVEIVQ